MTTVTVPRTIVSPTLYRIEIIRQLRNPFTLAFTLALPIAMYVLFGVSMDYADASAGNGNVAWYIMVSMAAFGTATAMSSMCSLAASEVRQGWGRQIAMTPLPAWGYVLTKVVAAVTLSALSVCVLFLVGVATGAEADHAWMWFAAAGLILGLGIVFGFWGLGVGMLFNADSAAALASIAITFFCFFGNVFMPLSGFMLDVARFTPMYGYVALVRWPVTEGVLTDGTTSDPLWQLVLNVTIWALVFFAIGVAGVRRSRRRA
ncbi:MAG: ABC transporter permease [Microbacterium sp.]